MSKYLIKYVYEKWYDLEIEAGSREEALEKFWESSFTEEPRLVGGEVQKGIDIEEIEVANV
jgi:hypothetical protein